MVKIFPASLGLGTNELKNLSANVNIVTAYKDYIRSAAKLFCDDRCNANKLENDIDDIINLESNLAKVSYLIMIIKKLFPLCFIIIR